MLFDSDSENESDTVPEGHSAVMKLDDWLVFRSDNEAASLCYQLRLKWHTLLLRRLKHSNKAWSPVGHTLTLLIHGKERESMFHRVKVVSALCMKQKVLKMAISLN